MFCTDELSIAIFTSLRYGFFSEYVPVLVYYSHLTAIIASLSLGVFVYSNNKKLLPSKILFAIAIAFSLLAVLDIFLWTQIDSSVLLFLWSFWIFIFSTIFSLSFYFLYTLLKQRDVSFAHKLIAGIALLTVLFFSLTKFNLKSFDIPNCTAVEGVWMISAIFGFSFVLFIATLLFGIREAKKIVDKIAQKRAVFATIGVACFLIMFAGASYVASIANILGSEPDTFKLEQYGYFGMSIFIGFLTYIIVQYKAFNIKLIAAQALVVALAILIGSQFFFIRTNTNRILNSVTFILAIIFGFFLVRSVKREVAQRERIEKLAGELQEANEHQASLIHFITHQVKGFLTKSRYIFGALGAGEYGALASKVAEVVKQGLAFNTDGVNMVQNVLRAANIKTGKVAYEKKRLDFQKLVEAEIEKQRTVAEEKGLALSAKIAPGAYALDGDAEQLSHAIQNLLDNAIKYTPKGEVSVSLEKKDGAIRFAVKDSGIGISEKDKEHIFTEGGRGENSQKVNVDSTGYGLYIVKGIIEAHGGKVWYESKGDGNGTTFFVEVAEVK